MKGSLTMFSSLPRKYVKGNIRGPSSYGRLWLECDDFKVEDDEGYFHIADDFCDEVNEWSYFKYFAINYDGDDETVIPN